VLKFKGKNLSLSINSDCGIWFGMIKYSGRPVRNISRSFKTHSIIKDKRTILKKNTDARKL